MKYSNTLELRGSRYSTTKHIKVLLREELQKYPNNKYLVIHRYSHFREFRFMKNIVVHTDLQYVMKDLYTYSKKYDKIFLDCFLYCLDDLMILTRHNVVNIYGVDTVIHKYDLSVLKDNTKESIKIYYPEFLLSL